MYVDAYLFLEKWAPERTNWAHFWFSVSNLLAYSISSVHVYWMNNWINLASCLIAPLFRVSFSSPPFAMLHNRMNILKHFHHAMPLHILYAEVWTSRHTSGFHDFGLHPCLWSHFFRFRCFLLSCLSLPSSLSSQTLLTLLTHFHPPDVNLHVTCQESFRDPWRCYIT